MGGRQKGRAGGYHNGCLSINLSSLPCEWWAGGRGRACGGRRNPPHVPIWGSMLSPPPLQPCLSMLNKRQESPGPKFRGGEVPPPIQSLEKATGSGAVNTGRGGTLSRSPPLPSVSHPWPSAVAAPASPAPSPGLARRVLGSRQEVAGGGVGARGVGAEHPKLISSLWGSAPLSVVGRRGWQVWVLWDSKPSLQKGEYLRARRWIVPIAWKLRVQPCPHGLGCDSDGGGYPKISGPEGIGTAGCGDPPPSKIRPTRSHFPPKKPRRGCPARVSPTRCQPVDTCRGSPYQPHLHYLNLA